MKAKLPLLSLIFGLALILVIGTILLFIAPAKAAVAAPAWGSLTVTKLGSGTGTVESINFTGINCGTDCNEFYDAHNIVISATPSADSFFTGWGGDCGGTAITCTVYMSDDRNVTAYFTRVYSASVAKEGNGSGLVTSDPASIDCGVTCGGKFYPDTVVTLTASVNPGSQFGGWAGDCIANGLVCVATMSTPKDITATFTLITYTVSVTREGDGDGSVISTPDGIDCGDRCSAIFDHNTVVTYTANPITGSRLSGWAGDCAADGPICVSTVTATRNVTATFRMITTNLAVSQSYVRRGSAITFTVVVVNHGPTGANGTIVSDTIPPDITRPQWSCQTANGASCPPSLANTSSASCRHTSDRIAEASGSGYLIHDTLLALPVGGIVTYTIRGNLCMYIPEVVNQVDITPPIDVHDLSHADNSATVTTGYRVMVPMVLRGG